MVGKTASDSGGSRFLGIDLGAGSVRVMLGTLEGGRLRIEEAHRFPNEPVQLGGTLCWDFPGIFAGVIEGIRRGAALAGGNVQGIGVDSWGVDFGLLDRRGDLLANPVHYRDARTDGVMEDVLSRIPRERIFEETGVQFLSLNTLYQVAALSRRSPEILAAAGRLLLVADLVAYFLTGRAAAEMTLASTTQLWNPVERTWSRWLAAEAGLPLEILPDPVPPATLLAPLRPEIARAAGLREPSPVIAAACHDTAAAVAAVPAEGERSWAYISSGTWSLVGAELESPLLSRSALERNFTNEAGAGGTTRFLRNLNGLWLVRECRRRWALDGEDLGYSRLGELAAAAGPARSWIQPAHPTFFAPGDMPAAIREYTRRTGQPAPETPGEHIRCALESLAFSYREVIEDLREVAGIPVSRVHLVGGGARDGLHAQLTADALRVPVLAGPVEATAAGNILLQAMATGLVRSIAEVREIVRRSFEPRLHEPRPREDMEEKYEAFRRLPRA
jgi:rhamnulokinase